MTASNDRQEGRFLRACRLQKVDCTPVWMMRQAGRYLPEYRRLRERYTLLEICGNPELAAEVTLQPIRRFDLDAAIIFADILLPLKGMGLDFRFAAGEGPVISEPVRSPEAVRALHTMDPWQHLPHVMEALRLVRRELDPGRALIGFCGAPFTLASYMIEGGRSKNFQETKRFMYTHPDAWKELMGKLVEVQIAYLNAQVDSGAQAVQLFDSWVGSLGPADYREYVLPFSRALFQGLKHRRVPLIHFGTGTGALLEDMQQAGGTVLGVDWRVDLDQVWLRLGSGQAIQGNLDPLALMAPRPILKRKVREVLGQARGRRGHIFNLGHGVLPATDPDAVAAMVDWVREESK